MSVRVRFAPSPTGFLHIGGLRTALYNFLFARKHNGVFILRIEDTDQTRAVEGALENLIQTLTWCGLEADEGPMIENSKPQTLNSKQVQNPNVKIIERGNFGPYTQSQRLNFYKQYAEQLVEQGNAYECFCTSKDLEELRKRQTAAKQTPRYDGRCLMLSKEERTIRKTKDPYVIRLHVPEKGSTRFEDLIHGIIEVQNHDVDHQVLMKSDGYPTYHLANVVDDHLMNITHVIRGEEWLPSTPKHIILYDAFGWEAPQFAHLPLLLNPDKTKLSKRQGDVAVEEYIKKGYLKETLINFVALLGWNPKGDQELYTLDELIQQFDITKVNKGGAVLNHEKLDWMNGSYIRKLSLEQLRTIAVPYFPPSTKNEFLDAVLQTVGERIKHFDELPALTHFYFEDPTYDSSLLVWKKSTPAQTKERLHALLDFYTTGDIPWNAKRLEEQTQAFIAKKNLGVGDTLWPMRVALSGEKNSPGPFEIAAVLGKEKTCARLQKAHEKLSL